MNAIIYKYAAPGMVFTLDLPPGAKFLSAHLQQGAPQLWFLLPYDAVEARVDPLTPPTVQPEQRRFQLVPTGDVFCDGGDDTAMVFLATLVIDAKGLVFHLFELVPVDRAAEILG